MDQSGKIHERAKEGTLFLGREQDMDKLAQFELLRGNTNALEGSAFVDHVEYEFPDSSRRNAHIYLHLSLPAVMIGPNKARLAALLNAADSITVATAGDQATITLTVLDIWKE